MKRIDLKVAPSRSTRNLLSLRTLDDGVPHVQELLTKAGFENGEGVSIVSTKLLDALVTALEPFANAGGFFLPGEAFDKIYHVAEPWWPTSLTIDHLRAAARALGECK